MPTCFGESGVTIPTIPPQTPTIGRLDRLVSPLNNQHNNENTRHTQPRRGVTAHVNRHLGSVRPRHARLSVGSGNTKHQKVRAASLGGGGAPDRCRGQQHTHCLHGRTRNRLEMLFVAPNARSAGVGKRVLTHGIHLRRLRSHSKRAKSASRRLLPAPRFCVLQAHRNRRARQPLSTTVYEAVALTDRLTP